MSDTCDLFQLTLVYSYDYSLRKYPLYLSFHSVEMELLMDVFHA